MKLKVVLFVVSILFLSVSIIGSNALPEEVSVNNPANMVHKTSDDKFLEVAAKVPGFGGMFKDGDVMKVYMVNPTHKQAAEAAIASVFGRERIPKGGIQVIQGQYSFSELKKWHESMGNIFNIPGIIFTDVDDSSNRLKVGVESLNSSGVVEQELIKQGIPRGAFVIEKAEPVVYATTLLDRIRPIQGGIQIHFSGYLCTLGFNGIRSGIIGFVVNSHCTDSQGVVENTSYYQPYIEFIGNEIADPPYFDCAHGIRCRNSDAAFAERADGVPANIGLIARPDSLGSLNIAGNFRIVSEDSEGSSIIVGDSVNKVGRTTGWTQGNVTNINAHTIVSGTNIVQLNQTWVSAGVAGGDSGSPVFKIINNPQQYDVILLGILWGGTIDGSTFVYSPFGGIENDLGQIQTTSIKFINGTVKDNSTGYGLNGITVSINTTLSTKTDATGFYSFAVSDGSYDLTAYDIRYYTNITTVSTNGQDVVWQDIELVQKPTGNITGSVIICCTMP